MAKLKFKDENNNFIPVVQDVKVNGASVFDGEDANVSLRTINNQSIVGTGNIDIDVDDVVKTIVNQGLTNQQKINARNNIEALGTGQVKQQTGQSTTDVMSQKGVTDALANKQDNKPNGVNLLVSTDTGKIDLVYIPSTVLGGITNGGTFNGQGVITASSYDPELNGEIIDQVSFSSYPSYYFICSAPYSFAGFDFAVGDWAISLGSSWAKLNATDAVTSVNGKMGQVVLDYSDVGATKSAWGSDNANKNLVTDASGNVITSDYALGQIIVDYYTELPTDVPETAKASVINSQTLINPIQYADLDNYYSENFPDMYFKETPTQVGEDYYISFANDENDAISIASTTGYTEEGEETIWADFQRDNYTVFYTYIYSWTDQTYINDSSQQILTGWNKMYYDEGQGIEVIVPVNYSDVESISNVYLMDYYCDQNFLNNFGEREIKLAGEYIYTEVQPPTNPKTYYWKYTPANVQSDFNITDITSLGYIKNKPVLDTTNTTAQTTSNSEVLVGTINFHKVSKTGTYSDLIDTVGRKSSNGEIFNSYTGATKNVSTGNASHAEGYITTASGNSSHAEGENTRASNSAAHAEGYNVTASGAYSHAEGYSTTASKIGAHSEGGSSTAIGNYAHCEGMGGAASGDASHAEGESCQSIGANAHAEGKSTTANAPYSHTEGVNTSTFASAGGSHAEGVSTSAGAASSHVEGEGTISNAASQHVEGKYNTQDSNCAHILGNGTSSSVRSNAHTIDWNGNAWFAGDIKVGGTSYSTGSTLISGTNNGTNWTSITIAGTTKNIPSGGGGGGGSIPLRKTLTNSSQNYSVSNNVVTVTDADVSTSKMIMLYPSDTTTETWLENNLSSCIITEASGSFSFSISASLPATFSMYYIIMEVQ